MGSLSWERQSELCDSAARRASADEKGANWRCVAGDHSERRGNQVVDAFCHVPKIERFQDDDPVASQCVVVRQVFAVDGGYLIG